MWYFLLNVIQGTIATLEVNYISEKKLWPAIFITGMSSVLSYFLATMFIEATDRHALLAPWVLGDVAAVIGGLLIKRRLEK